MPLMALAMELLSCACPAGVAVLCCKRIGEILHGGEDALVACSAPRRRSRPRPAAPDSVTCDARERDGLSARVSAGGDHRSARAHHLIGIRGGEVDRIAARRCSRPGSTRSSRRECPCRCCVLAAVTLNVPLPFLIWLNTQIAVVADDDRLAGADLHLPLSLIAAVGRTGRALRETAASASRSRRRCSCRRRPGYWRATRGFSGSADLRRDGAQVRL